MFSACHRKSTVLATTAATRHCGAGPLVSCPVVALCTQEAADDHQGQVRLGNCGVRDEMERLPTASMDSLYTQCCAADANAPVGFAVRADAVAAPATCDAGAAAVVAAVAATAHHVSENARSAHSTVGQKAPRPPSRHNIHEIRRRPSDSLHQRMIAICFLLQGLCRVAHVVSVP